MLSFVLLKARGGRVLLGLGFTVRIGMCGVTFFLHKQMRRSLSLFLSLSLSLFVLSALFQRTTLVSDHLPQNNRALSPFLSLGGFCPAGSSAVASCPAGAIDWRLCFYVLALPAPLSHVLPCGVPYFLVPLANEDFYCEKRAFAPMISSSSFVLFT